MLDSASEEFIARLSAEHVDKAVRNLELGKACGPDNLSAEHLIYAHPLLIIHMRLLFNMIFANAVVPGKFGEGFMIPLVKDKSGNLNNVTNYRGITLVPVISKVLEGVISAVCLSCFDTDDHQFGFKKGKGCTDAIYLFTTTVDHFIDHGSSVFVAALDISKAFDKVDHNKLFTLLGEAGISSRVVNIVKDWYNKLCARVRSNGAFSKAFCVPSGVRLGSLLLPSIFNVFNNAMIISIIDSHYGCHLSQLNVSCIFYADDILLISASVTGLQNLLDVCSLASVELGLTFNVKKSSCIAFGALASKVSKSLNLRSQIIPWNSCLQYLGANFISGKKIQPDIDNIKGSFLQLVIVSYLMHHVVMNYYVSSYKKLMSYLF
jgi:hypothetical protein